MDIFDVLREEHLRVLGMLERLVGAPSAARAQDLRTRIETHLRAMVRIEEQDLYPLLLGGGVTHDPALHLRNEGRELEARFSELGHIPPDEDRFRESVQLLHRELQRHFAAKERELFPRARRLVSDDLSSRLAEDAAREIRRLPPVPVP